MKNNDEKNVVKLPIELPNFKTKEELEKFIDEKENYLNDLKDSLKMFIWCTNPGALKPTEMSTYAWVDNNIDHLIGKHNNIGKTEIQLYCLKLWYENWDDNIVIEGFSKNFDRNDKDNTEN